MVGTTKALLSTLASMAALLTPALADSGLGDIDSKVGEWTILRKQDPMTDAPSCVAIYKDDPRIQMTTDSLAIAVRGIQGYQVRLDNLPPSPMKLPTDIEKQIDAVVLDGDWFQRIMHSHRVRFQAVTYSGIENKDIKLDEVSAVYSALSGVRCRKS